jgi:hypothetical protein
MALIRNSLEDDNKKIREAFQNSNFDKSSSFDKIISMMLLNCNEKIKENEIEKVKLYIINNIQDFAS